MDSHYPIEIYSESNVTDVSDVHGSVGTQRKPHKKILVIGDESSTRFFGMYHNRYANDHRLLEEEEVVLFVQYATFPKNTMPTIYNILHLLGSYSFDMEPDIILVCLLHCDILRLNHQKGFCWAHYDLRQSDVTDLCARYATLHKWLLERFEGENRHVTVQFLMPPSFHFTKYNQRYFQYLDRTNQKEKETGQRHFKEGEDFLTVATRTRLINEVYTYYIAHRTWFSTHWSDHYSELELLDVDECINKAYIVNSGSTPEEQNLRRELYTIAEGNCPSHYVWCQYSPFSLDGIIPSHEGVVRILRQALVNHTKINYSKIVIPRTHVNHND